MMDKNLHEIDQFFLDSLENYEEDPAEDVWASVENDLNKTDVVKYKTKYKFLLRGVVCLSLLLISLWLNDIIQTYTYRLKQSDKSIANFKAKQSSKENNKSKKRNGNNTFNDVYITKHAENNLYLSKSNDSKSEIEKAGDKIFQEDKFYSHNQIQQLDSILIFKKRDKFLPPKNLPAINKDAQKWFQFPGHASAKNQMLNKQKNQSIQLKAKHNFYIIPFFSYDIIKERLLEQYKYDNQDQLAVAKREKPDASYTLGLLAEYRLSKKYSVQAGISLSNSFTSISSTVIRAIPDNSGTYKFKLATTYGLAEIKRTGMNPQNGDSIRLKDASLQLQYVSVPVMIKYQIKPGNFNVSGLAGIGVNRIVNEKMEVEYASNTNAETEVVEKIEGLKKTFITLIVGGEASYTVNKRISIGISPAIRYSLTPVNEGTPIKTFPVSISTAALVKIKL